MSIRSGKYNINVQNTWWTWANWQRKLKIIKWVYLMCTNFSNYFINDYLKHPLKFLFLEGYWFSRRYLKNGEKKCFSFLETVTLVVGFTSFFDHKYRFSYSKIENLNKFEDSSHPVIKAVLKNEWKKINNGLKFIMLVLANRWFEVKL